MTVYFISQNEKHKNLFKHTEEIEEPIADELFTELPQELKLSRDLHNVLVQLCRGTSETVLLQADTENGLEELRRLHAQFKQPSLNA